jgi:hypothetical protein
MFHILLYLAAAVEFAARAAQCGSKTGRQGGSNAPRLLP